MENEEQKQEEVVQEEVVEQAPVEAGDGEQAPADRPLKNWQIEQARKEREIAELRAQLDAHKSAPQQQTRNPNDISTWADHELKAIVNSIDPSVLPYKDQAADVLLERKVERIREKERMQEKRAMSDLELRKSYPQAMDPGSEFALKMEEVMHQFDLSRTPAGRLAAAKIVAGEMGLSQKKASTADRKKEDSRVSDVKAQMVDGDRSKPQQNPDKQKNMNDLVNRANNTKDINASSKAFGEILKETGMDRDSFFKGSRYTGR